MILKFLRRIFSALLRLANDEFVLGTLKYLVRTVTSTRNSFVTVLVRPKRAAEITLSLCPPPSELTAIVVQGPLVVEDSFTLETLKLYSRIFPDCVLIFSTWHDLPLQVAHQVKSIGVRLVISQKPENPGSWNFNYQVVSTNAGLREAEMCGAAFVAKTRSDQRIHNPSTLRFVSDLTRLFPYRGEGPQRQRLVACSLNTFLDRAYSISDMFLFGSTGDMLTYWSIPQVQEHLSTDALRSLSDLELQKNGFPEKWLTLNLLKASGVEPTESVDAYLEVVASRYIVVSASDLDLYWHKNATGDEYRDNSYKADRRLRVIDFPTWLGLLSQFGELSDPCQRAVPQSLQAK